VLTVATQVLATRRMRGWTVDEIAASAGVGKASLYRRWPALDALLADVIADLGVRHVDFGDGPGEDRQDIIRLLTEATTGDRALAEAAIAAEVGVDQELRQAYARGPIVRFFTQAHRCSERARARGEVWPATLAPLMAGWSFLLFQVATTGQQPSLALLEDIVDEVVLPSLRIAAAISAARL